jgi:hypothetical protein
MPVTGYLKVDRKDFEKLIPPAQTAAGISPIKLKISGGDISQQIMALEIAAGVPVALRHQKIDRQDQEAVLVSVQNRLNARTCTISIGANATVTLASHGWLAGQGVQFATTGALPTGITAGTTYYLVPTVAAGSFNFSATKGGAAVTTSGTQSGTQSVYAV